MPSESPQPLDRHGRVYLAGHRGLVGSAILRLLKERGFDDIVVRTHAELDLRRQADVERFFDEARPTYVILAAAKVGGIVANSTLPADFIYDNLAIATNVIESSRRTSVKKLLNLGSSCIYPRLAPQPMKEEYLLTGPLESTNRAYAIAKIAAIELCDHYRAQHGCDFISAMPTNLYGTHDNFDLTTSHVIPALIRKFWEGRRSGAKAVTLWGTGSPRREFLYVDDMADACLFLLDRFSEGGPINIGCGEDLTIKELSDLVRAAVGYEGETVWDHTKPDGTPRKLMDVTRLRNLGWTSKTSLTEGLANATRWYADHVGEKG